MGYPRRKKGKLGTKNSRKPGFGLRLLGGGGFLQRSHNGWTSKSAWLEEFERAKKKAYAALATQDTDMVLLVLFDRLYTLRNQIIHGGATYGSEANREQLSHACKILTALLPEIVQIMQLHADRDWGRPFYPMIKND